MKPIFQNVTKTLRFIGNPQTEKVKRRISTAIHLLVDKLLRLNIIPLSDEGKYEGILEKYRKALNLLSELNASITSAQLTEEFDEFRSANLPRTKEFVTFVRKYGGPPYIDNANENNLGVKWRIQLKVEGEILSTFDWEERIKSKREEIGEQHKLICSICEAAISELNEITGFLTATDHHGKTRAQRIKKEMPYFETTEQRVGRFPKKISQAS